MSRQPPIDSSPEREPTPVEQAALGWVVRCERGLSVEQERELASWLAADGQHGELFAEFGGTWILMGQADPDAVSVATTAESREGRVLRFEQPAAKRAARRSARATWLSLAAAAVIAMGVASWWRGGVRDSAVATEIGASRQLTLSDGSIVALNTDSSVVTAFMPEERRVRLEKGEAFFQVAKDAARPFVVEAAGVGVRAVGTAFNVRVHPTSIEVLVTEGKVRVAPNTSALGDGGDFSEVAAGQRVNVSLAAPSRSAPEAPARLEVAHVPADEVRRRLAWQGRRLDFSDTPLEEMVAEFNRYNRHKIVVIDAELAPVRFGGSFRPGDRVGFVRMLRENFGIVAEERAGETTLRASAR
jgi:transmembrane sensor